MSVIDYFYSLDPAKLLKNLPGGIAQGILWGLMALGVYITFRLIKVSDLTVEGSFATGGAVTVVLITGGGPAWLRAIFGASSEQ
ncbi:MAG: ABC transporter permease, partial [Oscillospiraceae bacterium]|nr:ABC transporter permease [Oscillospiraceae bacterium]